MRREIEMKKLIALLLAALLAASLAGCGGGRVPPGSSPILPAQRHISQLKTPGHKICAGGYFLF